MIDFGYLYRGLCGMARAHRAGELAGHMGAAVVAGYFFGEDQHDLPQEVHDGVQRELDRVIRGEEAIWFDAERADVTIGQLFEPLPDEQPREELIGAIGKALAWNIDRTRQSGHNVIFAALAVRALRDHPRYATPAIVDGICTLIARFNDAPPGRGYYGRQRGWITGDKVEVPDDRDPRSYESAREMVDMVVDELIASASERRRGFGGLHHLVNHAAALTELAQYGMRELAQSGWAAHRQHLRLWRTLPDLTDELGAPARSKHDPRTPAYWTTGNLRRDTAMLTHRVKTLYGYFTLRRFIENPAKRVQADQALLYLMS